MTPQDLLQRIIAARTPTINTEDELTIAKLHDFVIEWVTAGREYRRYLHEPHPSPPPDNQFSRLVRRLRNAEDALDAIAMFADAPPSALNVSSDLPLEPDLL